jgi:hypothetical protein
MATFQLKLKNLLQKIEKFSPGKWPLPNYCKVRFSAIVHEINNQKKKISEISKEQNQASTEQ